MKELAELIISKLKENGITIQRYNSYSTKSIYLKFDYGVGNSLRISDHKGKKHLSYRFNLLMDIKERYSQYGEYPRHFYGRDDVEKLIRDIIQHRDNQMKKYGGYGYERLMDSYKKQGETKRGFWQQAVLV